MAWAIPTDQSDFGDGGEGGMASGTTWRGELWEWMEQGPALVRGESPPARVELEDFWVERRDGGWQPTYPAALFETFRPVALAFVAARPEPTPFATKEEAASALSEACLAWARAAAR